MSKQRVDIPGQIAAPLGDTVGETVDLFGFQLAVFRPTHDVAAGGCADINGKISLHFE